MKFFKPYNSNKKETLEEVKAKVKASDMPKNLNTYLGQMGYTILKSDLLPSHQQFIKEQLLPPKLHIHDLKTDKRIAFVSGIRGMQELQAQVDSGKMKAAFGLFPVAMSQLKLIADTNNIMPPKSTWVEPKMRSGLVIYSLAD